uniref:protease SohB n=1 Tax=Orrella sp. TaxID=1921583 RepID=UPI004047668C
MGLVAFSLLIHNTECLVIGLQTLFFSKDAGMEFFSNYLEFLAKVGTLGIAIMIVLGAISSMRRRGRQLPGQLRVRKLNDFFLNLQQRLELSILDKKQAKKFIKDKAKTVKLEKQSKSSQPRVFVLDFDGDIRATATDSLRHEITALLGVATTKDEVLLRLESGGGLVSSYGLAASQLVRIRQAGIPLTICIDKVAASGGYMMACIGNKIISSPFAMLGSIGVVAQIPNLHRLLNKYEIDYEVLTSGEHKRTLTVLGKNTEKGREKFQQDLEVTHQLFKSFVARYRSQLDIDKVATGEVWLGVNALENQLVDELKTSDEYLTARAKDADLYHLQYFNRKTFQERVGLTVSTTVDRFILNWISRLNQQKY